MLFYPLARARQAFYIRKVFLTEYTCLSATNLLDCAFSGPVAQSVEQLSFKQRVGSSNLPGITVPIAQLDRAVDYGSAGLGFESL